jgi:hypothetical protein
MKSTDIFARRLRRPRNQFDERAGLKHFDEGICVEAGGEKAARLSADNQKIAVSVEV